MSRGLRRELRVGQTSNEWSDLQTGPLKIALYESKHEQVMLSLSTMIETRP